MSSWRDDTSWILSDVIDGQTATVTVRTATLINSTPAYWSGTSDLWTGTVLIQNQRGNFRTERKGLVKEATHMIFFPYTSTVTVGSRIFESGATDFYEVLNVDPFEDHKEIDARLVENR